MSFGSFGSFGSSGNSSLAWSMGNGGKGRLILEFPFPLDKGWYKEQLCTQFQTFEHRKERTGFQHEFIVLRLSNGSVCRIERMGDPNARFDALSRVGSVAYDMAQCFRSDEMDQACLDTSDIVAEITLPYIFDLMDVLKICRAIHEGGKTRNYTLQVFNCYFFSLAIQVCLTRLVAHWENEDIFATWLHQVKAGIDALEATPQSTASIPERLYSALTHRNHESCDAVPLRKRIQMEYYYRAYNERWVESTQKALAIRMNNLLWHSAIDSDMDQFLEGLMRDIFTGIIETSLIELRDIELEVFDIPPSMLGQFRKGLKTPQIETWMGNLTAAGLTTGTIPNSPSNHSPWRTKVMKQKKMHRYSKSPEAKISVLNFNAAPAVQITQDLATDYYRWALRCIPYLILWIMHVVLIHWGITLLGYDTAPIPCLFIDDELGRLLSQLEGLETIEYSDVKQFMQNTNALISNELASWRNPPWADTCAYIKRHVILDIPNEIDELKPTGNVCLTIGVSPDQDYPESSTINISDLQRRAIARIEAHARNVERVGLGSAAGIHNELVQVLSQVWKSIREDDSFTKKTQTTTANVILRVSPRSIDTNSSSYRPQRKFHFINSRPINPDPSNDAPSRIRLPGYFIKSPSQLSIQEEAWETGGVDLKDELLSSGFDSQTGATRVIRFAADPASISIEPTLVRVVVPHGFQSRSSSVRAIGFERTGHSEVLDTQVIRVVVIRQ